MPNGDQLTVSFEGLTPAQKQQTGGLAGFQSAVSQQQQQFAGLNEDVAIGNVIGNLRRQAAPPPTPTPAPQIVPTVQQPALTTTDQARDRIDLQVAETGDRLARSQTDLERRFQEILDQPRPEFAESPEAQLAQQRFEALQAQRAPELAGIQRAFQQERIQAQQAGRRALGGTKAALARIGALTATPVIAEQRQESQRQATLQVLNRLTAAEQSALQSARSAFAAQDFEFAQQQLQNARAFRQDIETTQQRQLQNLLGVSQEVRALRGEAREERAFAIEQQQQQREDFLGQLTTAPGLFESLLPEDKLAFEQSAGLVPGFVDEFVAVTQAQQQAQSLAEQRSAEIDLIKILKDVPQNISIPLADGSIVTGLEPVESNTQTFRTEDPLTGNVTFSTIDKDSGLLIGSQTQQGIAGFDPIEQRKTELEVLQLQNEVFGLPGQAPSGFVSLTPKDITKNNKEIVNSDQFKGITTSVDSGALLNEFEKTFERLGTATFGAEGQELKTAYNALLLNLKEYFNLGVIAGPDLELMQNILPDPTRLTGFLGRGGKETVRGAIDNVKKMLIDKSTREYNNLLTQWQDFSPDQLTNLQTARNNYETLVRDNSEFLLERRVVERPGDLETINQLLGEGIEPADIELLLREAAQPLSAFRNDLGTSLNRIQRQQAREIGGLSAQFESSGDPGAVGFDRVGGNSFGTFQLARGNADTFVKNSQFSNEFKGLKSNQQEFINQWRDVARNNPEEFAAEQRQFIKQTHFDPQARKVEKETGLDLSKFSDVLKDVLWSTAVQHGPGTNIIVGAFKALGRVATEADFIREIYNRRWAGGRQFASSTPQVQQSVFNRFFGPQGELATALAKITGTIKRIV